MPEARRFRADFASGLSALPALPSSLPVGAMATVAPVKLRATEPAWVWAKRSAEKTTSGEKAAIRSTARPDAIQFSVVSVLAAEVSATTTRRNPTYTTVATTNLERKSPSKNSARVVAAPAARGQIESTQTRDTNEVTVKMRAERTTSSRCTITASELTERAVKMSPKVLTCGPVPAVSTTALLTATLCTSRLLRPAKSGVQTVASSAA